MSLLDKGGGLQALGGGSYSSGATAAETKRLAHEAGFEGGCEKQRA